MACRLNLSAAVRYIHWAPPGDLDGLHQVAKAKVEALGLSVGRRSHATPENIPGDPSINARGILNFIEGVEALTPADDLPENKRFKDAKQAQHAQLVTLYATLNARLNAAGYAPTPAEPTPPAPPLPAPTPDPKPLA